MAKIPTYGYRKTDGAAQLFELEPGEALPEDYADSPAKCEAAAPDSWAIPPAKPPKAARKKLAAESDD